MAAENPAELTLTHHSGWPWPLDVVQDWFDSFWDAIQGWIADVARQVWTLLPSPLKTFAIAAAEFTSDVWADVLNFLRDPVSTLKSAFDTLFVAIRDVIGWWDPVQSRFVGGFLGWLWDSVAFLGGQVSAGAGWLWDQMGAKLTDVWNAVKNFGEWAGDQLRDVGGWLQGTIWGWVDGALRWASDSFRWLRDELSETGSWIVDQVGTAFDGASTAIGDTLQSIFGPLGAAIAPLADALGPLLSGAVATDAIDASTRVAGTLTAMLDGLMVHSSPMTPEEAWIRAQDAMTQITAAYTTQTISNIIVEAASLGQVDISTNAFFLTPAMSAGRAFYDQIVGIISETSVLTSLRAFFLEAFTPTLPALPDARRMVHRGILTLEQFRQVAAWQGYAPLYQRGFVDLVSEIPGPGDLVRFVVREVISPADFTIYMAKQGFGAYWADAFWMAHWVLPAPDMLYDAFHRGVISEDELNKYVVWHDYAPEKRPGITKSDMEILAGIRKTLIPRVDLRRGWELGAISDKDLEKRYEMLGYEEDAPLMAEIQRRVALDAEIGKLRDNAKTDFVKGYIDEATLRADLADLGYSETLIHYHVADALGDRDRKQKDLLADFYGDAYVKDLISEDEARDYLATILVIPAIVELEMDRRYVQKYRKPPAPKAEKVREATLATLATAFRNDLLSETDFRAELTRRLYTPENIDLIVSVETLKKAKGPGE